MKIDLSFRDKPPVSVDDVQRMTIEIGGVRYAIVPQLEKPGVAFMAMWPIISQIIITPTAANVVVLGIK